MGRKDFGWTFETVIKYFERIFEEKDKALISTVLAVKEATALAVTAVKEAQAAALEAVKQENAKTELAAEERFKLLNELRGGVATKEQVDALEKVVEELKIYKAIAESKAEGWLVWLGLFFTGASFFFSLIGIAVAIYNSFFSGK